MLYDVRIKITKDMTIKVNASTNAHAKVLARSTNRVISFVMIGSKNVKVVSAKLAPKQRR